MLDGTACAQMMDSTSHERTVFLVEYKSSRDTRNRKTALWILVIPEKKPRNDRMQSNFHKSRQVRSLINT